MKDNAPKLGQLITDEVFRDAIHIAVAPVELTEKCYPGDRVALTPDGKATASGNHIGIIDPYLPAKALHPGDKVWLFMFPNTITGLRHEWTHPAFAQAKVETLAPDHETSVAWLRQYAARVNSYEDSTDAAYERFMNDVRDGEIFYHGNDCHSFGDVYDPDELFKHLSVVLGREVSQSSFQYSCSC